MKKTYGLFILILSFQLSFAQGVQILFPPKVLSMAYPNYVSACQLPGSRYKQLEIYTRFLYKGNKAIVNSPDKKCRLNVELKFADSTKIPKSFFEDLNKIRHKDSKKYLLIDVIGMYEDDLQLDSGRLANPVFRVSVVSAIQRIPRRAPRFLPNHCYKKSEFYTDYQDYALDRW